MLQRVILRVVIVAWLHSYIVRIECLLVVDFSL